MFRWLRGRAGGYGSLYEHQRGFIYQQKFTLVNVKLKSVKDRVLDAVVAGERDLRAVCTIVSIIVSNPQCCVPVYHLSRSRGQLGVTHDHRLSTLVRRYPNIFNEFHVPDSGGTPVPWFCLTPEALKLHQEELIIRQKCRKDLLDRLCKLLMLTKERTLPLQTIDQLKWDMGLPYDYEHSFIPNHPQLFSLCHLSDDRIGLRLLMWDDLLTISELQKNAASEKKKDMENGCLSFPIRFTRGFGLKRKCMEWLEEWQSLPYTSPYSDASHLDPRTDISEKRIVGVFHELLHLTLEKKTERKNVSNLRKPLALPQKFTKVFERHPGIFYISKKCDTQTVVLREAYDGQFLLQKHPLVDIREKYSKMMLEGFLGRSRGLFKRNMGAVLAEDTIKNVFTDESSDSSYESEGKAE
ncbi:protein WHAT'S THIS FACTOR 9, mitochondrial [Diospyros lotus]|uniref:protein WHAT'S THIS FACTOR 9, mitochondrial n=1 Tax=Diospyros lotus TaxID=55363 RepID=UPI00225238C3|nr:protein WHAT'S THIS FACTOR 9, mitochondrial [Diospyros lotus]XP_052173585.1 protein WHAT'S THIS FACTOR 9, mitochondrial [Diospyros lotus]XP_052173587.1 protein WHAT'S THIS FACTOR 9, mitochondrial [Diospyros lotus]XP_052173588.1 protein WHAT'S THIS FACTOR 9, mitochondrial [Diospyros lotus]XP_052173589.1 protein WHAT'S THIS FACTOR 9, mitochondrial [Diospyros lotus]XP_052173590.1 protein WHAT'S THIS FACTOR 9, mitochondrial [Diospyros lotus]XP_052173591.1 protein WHAT'S THIS FACTOR 9, mitochon